MRRRIEDHELQFAPQRTFVLPADDADSSLELLAAQPQFAVQLDGWQIGHKPRGGEKPIAEPRLKVLAIPKRPDSVELFADPPARWIDVDAPAVGQQEGRNDRLGGVCLAGS